MIVFLLKGCGVIILIKNLNEYSENTLTDENLVLQTQNNDEYAFDTLVSRYLPLIRIKTDKYIDTDKDDLVQEGLLGLWSAVQTYDPQKNAAFKTYAFICIENRMISGAKKGKGKKHIPSELLIYLDSDELGQIKDSNSPEQSIIERESYTGTVKHIKDILSTKEFKVLSYYLAGNTYGQIAEILNCDVKAVDNAIQRIRKKLKS